MALNDEQRSLLQLLLGGQSYEDIGSLLGTDAATVRERAREALTEVGGSDPDAKVGLTDYLLGKADPIGRADAVRQLQNDPESSRLASDIVSRLRLLAPNAQLPDVPAPKSGARRSAQAPPAPASPGDASGAPGERSSPLSGLRERAGRIGSGSGAGERSEDEDRRRKFLIAAGLAALLVVCVIVIVVVSGGGDDDSGEGTETTATQNADPDILSVALAPTGDAPGEGQATIAITQDQPLIQVNLSELEPAGRGQTYIIWLYSSDNTAFPLAQDRVSQGGVLNGQIPIPSQFLQAIALFGCVDVSLASVNETRQALQDAGEGIPSYVGTSIVRGEIPIPPETTAPSGPDSSCDRAGAQGAAGGAGGAGAQGGGGQGGAAQGGATDPQQP